MMRKIQRPFVMPVLYIIVCITLLSSCLTADDTDFKDATVVTPANVNVPLVYGDVMIEKLITEASLADLEETPGSGKYKIRYKYNLGSGNDLATEVNTFSDPITRINHEINERPPASGIFSITRTEPIPLVISGGHQITNFQFANGNLNIEITNNTGVDVNILGFGVEMGLTPAIQFGLAGQNIASGDNVVRTYPLQDKELAITNNTLNINYDTRFNFASTPTGNISIRTYISGVSGFKKIEGNFNKITMRLPEGQQNQAIDSKLFPDFGEFTSTINKMKAVLNVTSGYEFPINIKITSLEGINSTKGLYSVIDKNITSEHLTITIPAATGTTPTTEARNLDETKTTELTRFKPQSLHLEQETTLFDCGTNLCPAIIRFDQTIDAYINFSVVDLDLSREFEHSKDIPKIDNTELEKAELTIKGTSQYNAGASFELQPLDENKRPKGDPIILKKDGSEYLLEGSTDGNPVTLDTTQSITNEQVKNILTSKTIKLIVHLKSVTGDSFAFDKGHKMNISVSMKLNGKVTLKL